MRDLLLHRLNRWGLGIHPAPASVWVHGDTIEQFLDADEVISGLVADVPQMRLVLTARDRETVTYLRRRFRDERTLTLPRARFLGRLPERVRAGLLVELCDAARGSLTAGERQALRGRGLRIARWDGAAVVVDGDRRRFSASHRREALAVLRGLRPRARSRPVADAWRNGSWRDRVGQSRLWETASGWWRARRIDDWDVLRERLGNPRTILCLGNGPSSEDPALRDISYDCLMRVNWRWSERGLFTDPDVVFVGDIATVHKVSATVYGFWNAPVESAAVLRRLVTRWLDRMSYITMERLSPSVGALSARPTNGALMILAAAGLRPERLVIAGMDLFQHPDGRYPGDADAKNQYARSHSREVEIELIDQALRDYPGEVVILSERLRAAREQLREKRECTVSTRPDVSSSSN